MAADETFAELLAICAREQPDHPAIEDGERVVTYAGLDALTNTVAANLQAAGLGQGDRVAVLLPDSADHIITLCALSRIGAIIFSLSPSASKSEIAGSLEITRVSMAIADPDVALPGGIGRLFIDDISGKPTAPFDPPKLTADDPLMLVQTSATTGAAKFFLRSHGQSVEWARRYAECQELTATDRIVSLVGLSFHAGRSMAFTSLYGRSTLVIVPVRHVDDLVADVNARRISYLKLTPSHLGALVSFARDGQPLFPDLRLLSVTSAPITNKERQLARERLTSNIVELFGTNETGPLLLATPADQDAYPDAIGRAVEDVAVAVVDEDARPLPPGETGSLRFKGPGFISDYLEAPEETAQSFRDGWFYPRDLAEMNDQGYVFFKGRADDAIIHAGINFYPTEVEAALLEHPDVEEAAVFGWPLPPHGEVAAACLVTRSPLAAKAVQEFCADRIAHYKVPRIILFLPELPKNPMGKILKTSLKEMVGQRMADGPE